MSKEEILSKNRLIAEFMGWRAIQVGDGYMCHLNGKSYNGTWAHQEKDAWDIICKCKFKYNSSWDLLMPVVEKINSMFFCVTIYSDACRIEPWEDSIPFESLDLLSNFNKQIFIATYYREELNNGAKNLIEAVYKATIEFIKWYNKNKK